MPYLNVKPCISMDTHLFGLAYTLQLFIDITRVEATFPMCFLHMLVSQAA